MIRCLANPANYAIAFRAYVGVQYFAHLRAPVKAPAPPYPQNYAQCPH